MFVATLKVVGILFGAVIWLSLAYVVIRATMLYLDTRPKRRASIKRRFKHYLYQFMNAHFFNYFDFVKWVLWDFLHGKTKLRFFGIWCFTGYFGEGKTLGAVTYAKGLQKKYPELNIKIFTNFEMKGQEKKITCWQDLINLPRYSIVIFDEIQSTFTSQKFKAFPIDLLWKLTQCRKNKLMVFASSPVFSRMVIQLRENTDFVVTCSNNLGQDRYFSYGFYRAPDYERHVDNPIRLRLVRKFEESFVATNNHYRAYNTEAIVDRWDIEGEK